MLVSICVATYQRPEGLKRLMAGLDRLVFNDREVPNIEVIVVDNDPTCSARDFCQQLQASFKWSLKYFSEPQRGVSYVRNCAVAQADPNTDFISFIDDDQVPELNWMEELLTVQQQYNADVVAGPYLAYYPAAKVPKWVIKGKFFDSPRYPTGHLINLTGTGNVLIRSQVLKAMDKIFDERFALTGGEDTHLFMRIYRAGYKMVWADAAMVSEWVPESRTNIKWILRRGYRCHSTYAICEKKLDPLMKVLSRRIPTGSTRIAIGLVTLIPSLLLGRSSFVHALLQIAQGAGMFSGLMGRSYEEYKSVHGD
jgi:succinoglycan biosynthesis protein ExoM